MIDKKIILERLEKRIEYYENQKKSIIHKDVLETIDFTIGELKFMIETIEWGAYDVK